MSDSKRLRRARPGYLTRQEVMDRPLLVVEDEDELAQIQADLFRERWGCDVHFADSLEQTRELLRGPCRYFAASCKVSLPDAPNGEAIELLTKANIPTIAVAAGFSGIMREQIIDMGVFDYVLKNSIHAYAYVCEQLGFILKNQLTQVLVADDDPVIRMMLVHFLKRLRMRVLEAEDGVHALQLVEQNPNIRLALIDCMMPRMNGVRLTNTLRQMHGKDRMAIIGISSEDAKLLTAEFIKNGANDFIAKPFTFEEVVCRVRQNIEMLNLIEENRFAAFSDYLTGLPNRRCFFADGPPLLKHAGEAGQAASVAMIDIDHFKQINDSLGHDGGDHVLSHFATLLAESFSHHLVARLGGEEFGVLMTDCSREQAVERMTAFQARLARFPVTLGMQELSPTASIGVACSSDLDNADLDALLRLADAHLYAAKANGRNRVES